MLSPTVLLADGVGVLIQRSGDRLILGFDDGSDLPGGKTLGSRAFGGILGADSLTQFPSFLSLQTPPQGAEVLPPGVTVSWDFLPMTVGGVTSNLLFWDGADELTLQPASDARLTLFDPVFLPATVDGSAAAVGGLRLGTTTSSGLYRLHAHRVWYVEGQDGAAAPAGVYVAALRVRMAGLAPTPPLYVALGVQGMASAVFDTTLPWLEEHADSLLLRGDYNFDGLVDSADYGVWSQQYGATTPLPVAVGEADGNGDGVIDAADYTLWRDALGPAATSAPEPTAAGLLLMGLLVATRSRPGPPERMRLASRPA